MAYHGKGEFDRAIADYDEALKIDPTLAAAFTHRGNAYREKGDVDRAASDYGAAIGTRSDEIRLRSTIAVAPTWSRMTTNMRLLITRKRSGSIRNMPWPSTIADWLANKGELDRAIADLSEAMKCNLKYTLAFNNRDFTRLRRGELDRSTDDFDAALALDPKPAVSLYGRGMAKRKNGDPAGSDADLAAAKIIRPGIEHELASEIE